MVEHLVVVQVTRVRFPSFAPSKNRGNPRFFDVQMVRSTLSDCFFEPFACPESGHFHFRNFYIRPRLRINTPTCRPLTQIEGAKAGNAHLLTVFDSTAHYAGQLSQNALDLALGELSFLGKRFNQLLLSHEPDCSNAVLAWQWENSQSARLSGGRIV